MDQIWVCKTRYSYGSPNNKAQNKIMHTKRTLELKLKESASFIFKLTRPLPLFTSVFSTSSSYNFSRFLSLCFNIFLHLLQTLDSNYATTPTNPLPFNRNNKSAKNPNTTKITYSKNSSQYNNHFKYMNKQTKHNMDKS